MATSLLHPYFKKSFVEGHILVTTTCYMCQARLVLQVPLKHSLGEKTKDGKSEKVEYWED